MSGLDDLRNRLASIAQDIELAARPSADGRLAGWGQFVDAQAHLHQIGSYGTCAGIVTLLMADPSRAINQRISAQVLEFWRSGGSAGDKLRSQNVRLAFLVLCLAKTADPTLIVVRDEAVAELRRRQLASGAWGDWHHPTELAQARSETTAWVSLALARVLSSDAHAIRGAEYLLTEMTGAGATKRLSPVAVGAAISILPASRITPELVNRAFTLAGDSQIDDQENISFFDYVQSIGTQTRVARDYLCFPVFYPLTLMLYGLYQHANFLALPSLALRRLEATSTIVGLIEDGRPYRLRGAKFAATVDQAMIALSYENLSNARSRWDPLARWLRPVRDHARENWITQVIIPLAVLMVAAVTMEDPKSPTQLINLALGIKLTEVENWIGDHESIVRLLAAGLLMFSAHLPSSIYRFMRRKVIG